MSQSACLPYGLPKTSTRHETEAQKEQGRTHHHDEAVHEVIGAWASVTIKNMDTSVMFIIETSNFSVKVSAGEDG